MRLAVLLAVAASGALLANAEGRACITFEQTRWSASTRTVDKTMCADLLLDAIPPHVSPSTVILQFSGNRLAFLHRDMMTRLPLLEEADFSANEIVHIGFNLTSSTLSNLTLSANRLRTVPNGTFESLPNLMHLDLSRNQIWILFPLSFRGLTRLASLNLAANVINSIDPLAFTPLSSLYELNLSANMLQTLAPTVNHSLPITIRSLQIGSNRWHCDCNLLWLKQLVTERTLLYDKSDTLCITADVPSARTKRWFELRYAEFACTPVLVFPLGPLTVREQLVGTNASFECQTAQKAEIRWRRLDMLGRAVEISGLSNKYSISVTATTERNSATLTIQKVAESDAGTYYCEASNMAGYANSNFSLQLRQNGKERDVTPDANGALDAGADDEGLLSMIQNNTVNLLALIGALVGIIVIIIVLVAAIVYCVQLVAAKGFDQPADRAAKQRERLLDETANRPPSPAATSFTTVTVLPTNGTAPTAFEYSLAHGRYVPIGTQPDANRADSPAASEMTRTSNGTLNRVVKIPADSPYVTMYHACPVHGSRPTQLRETDPQFCPVHGHSPTFHHCPVHGDVPFHNDSCNHSIKSRLSEANGFNATPVSVKHQHEANCNASPSLSPSPGNFNLTLDDCCQQLNPNARVYIETDVDADLSEPKIQYELRKTPAEKQRCAAAAQAAEGAASLQSYSTAV